jgi:putative FmdB family regulatory protein
MPIYEYKCESCGEELEALQKVSEDPLMDCPACGKSSLKKKVSAAAFRLKGGGWYETDFKSGNKKNIAGGGDSAEGGKSDAGKSDAGKAASGGGDKKSGDAGSSTGDGKKSA